MTQPWQHPIRRERLVAALQHREPDRVPILWGPGVFYSPTGPPELTELFALRSKKFRSYHRQHPPNRGARYAAPISF